MGAKTGLAGRDVEDDDQREVEAYAVKSYRYLRLSIILVSASLLFAVLTEWRKNDPHCFQPSLSDYYWTPAQTVFAGGLIAIGVSLIAIRGRPRWEDAFLNVSGVLAPIVAFVPTSRKDEPAYCSSQDIKDFDTTAFIQNNVSSFAFGCAVALIITLFLAFLRKKTPVDVNEKTAWETIVFSVILFIAGFTWYNLNPEQFAKYAHAPAAIGMFAFAGIVMLINGHRGEKFRWVYYGTAGSMVLIAGVVLLIDFLKDWEWRHSVLWLEVLEMGAFTVFWFVQTVEHWSGGIPDPTAPAPPPRSSPAERVAAPS